MTTTGRPGDRWVLLGLAALAFAVYGRVVQHRFLLNWDDFTYVVDNEAIRGLTWSNLRSAFGRSYFENYAPLHLVSYAIDFSIWGGLAPSGFLLTNVALHAANGCLFHRLLVRLGVSRAGAAFAAAVFLVHPVQVESVAWVSERKNLLCMSFSLASLHAFVAYRAIGTGRRRAAYVASLAAAVAALLTKAVAVVLPPILVLLDLCHVEPDRRRHWVADKVPFAVAAVALAVVTVASQDGAIAEGRAMYWMDAPVTLYTMVPVVAQYVGMVLWPARLSTVYSPRIRETADPAFWASALLLVAFLVAGVWLWRRRRGWLLWYATFFVGLVPVLQIVPLPTLMNDRYLYFPMLGAAALAGIAVEGLARRGGAVAATLVAGAIVMALASASFVRTAVWRDDVTLWTDVTEKSPSLPLPWAQLGLSLMEAGRTVEGLQAYHRALSLDPSSATALVNLGAAYNHLGQPEAGRPFLLRAIQVAPDSFEAHMNLGIGLRMTGDLAGAERAFASALSVRPRELAALSALRDVQRIRHRP